MPKKNLNTAKIPTKPIVPKFYTTPVNIEDGMLVIKLPPEVKEYLEMEGSTLHWMPINGIVQLSGSHPKSMIPVNSFANCKFIPQKPQPILV